MDQQALTGLIGKTAALMEQFERRCGAIEQHQLALNHDLQRLGQQLPAVVRQSADGALQGLSNAVMGKVQDGLEQPVTAYQQRLRDAGGLLQNGSQALAAQLRQMQALHRQMIWKVLAVIAGSLLLLLTGGGWLLWQYRADIRDNQIAADLLRAYDRADVQLCAGRLCANMDTEGKTYGDKGQYRVVRSRR